MRFFMTRGAHRLGALAVLCWVGLTAGAASLGSALEPQEVLVLANKNVRGSLGLAQHYMEKRGIPKSHLLQLWITDKEQCSREDFEKKAVGAVQKYLREKDASRKIRCLVCMYGLPLKVAPPVLSVLEKKELDGLNRQRAELSKELEKAKAENSDRQKELSKNHDELNRRIREVRKEDHRASFDSELALILKTDYSLAGWLPNPLFVGFRGRETAVKRDEALIVARLDGPTEEIVRRMMDDSIAAERTGLKGTAYFDARWPRPSEDQPKKMDMGYGLYDRSIHLAAERVQKTGRMRVVVNDRQELFQPGECPDAAVYCGWYSLARYVPAFTWTPGAVGFHIASSECSTLKMKESQVWCKRMLEEGAAATLGPVSEPYVQAFPLPEVFFVALIEGRLTLAESYFFSLPFLSWQMVLLGDPLYRPFMN